MEQRIGSSSQPLKGEPVTGAGFDPAFIPGLTAPAGSSDEPEDKKAEDAETETGAEEPEVEEPEGEKSPDGEAEAEEADAEADGSDAEDSDEDAADDDADVDAADDDESEGPVFEASDRRAEIVADEKGVRLRLDDQNCEFRWDEIGAVETETPRFGKRFTITVHTPDRRWYPIEIEAAARSRFSEWETQLDAVLDAYFDDGEEDDADESAEVDEAALAEAEAEVRKD
ncbi:hypothetical protein R6V09_24275 [Streptomyces sp. W16]|uniref:hypothetical protein n=1 Tax=Streptomyces sp. W16 TaxID=3076631 RepID=UPI00295B29FF|nr:hypothetical protein [Streptomyces sp. W16]MDV9173214.1 hypothetical protein [Streptomyces sp. W16]